MVSFSRMDRVAFIAGHHDVLYGMHLDSDTRLCLDDLDFTTLEKGLCSGVRAEAQRLAGNTACVRAEGIDKKGDWIICFNAKGLASVLYTVLFLRTAVARPVGSYISPTSVTCYSYLTRSHVASPGRHFAACHQVTNAKFASLAPAGCLLRNSSFD